MSTIRALVVPVPPLAEQRRIMQRLNLLMELLERLTERLVAIKAVHHAFASAAVHGVEA